MNNLLLIILQGCSRIGLKQAGCSYACTVGTERSVVFHLDTKYHHLHHTSKM